MKHCDIPLLYHKSPRLSRFSSMVRFVYKKPLER